MAFVYFNGNYIDEREAVIPITDRGFLFGDGIFTSLRIEEGEIMFAEEHLNRLKQQCLQLNITFPKLEVSNLIEVIERNQADHGVWRMKIIITGGNSTELFLPKRDAGIILVTLKPYISNHSPMTLCVYPIPLALSFGNIKSLSYLERLAVKNYALEHGADDALVLGQDGKILETAFSNIFWLHENCVYTPKENSNFLRGIVIKNFLKNTTMPTKEGDFKVSDIPSQASIFLCNSLIGIVSVNVFITS